jgi:hypothetical protein
MSNLVEIEVRGGEPIIHGGHTLTPFSRSVRVKIPGLPGGLIWNRPVSVLAHSADGQEEIIPIHDVTRQIQWSLLGAGLAFGILSWLISRRR